MVRFAVLFLGLAACSFKGGGSNASSDPDSGVDGDTGDAGLDAPPGAMAYRKEITISGDAVSQTLANFPLYVQIAGDADLMARAETDGSDIFFASADGTTPLDFEIESWDPDAGDLVAWVRLTIDDTNGATLYLRYGEASVATPPNPPAVWTEGFLTVFHMNNDPGASDIIDSLGMRDGTPTGGMDANDLVGGQLGLGIDLDGNNDEIDFDNPITGASTHTISGWVNQGTSNGDGDAFVVLGSGGTLRGSRFLHTVDNVFSGGDVLAGFYSDDHLTNDAINTNGFHLVHWTYDDNRDSRVYIDGQLVDGPQNFGTAEDTQGMEGRIGNAPGGGMGFGNGMGLNGIVDEVRIAATARSAEWIAAEFANQDDPGAFYTLGNEEAIDL